MGESYIDHAYHNRRLDSTSYLRGSCISWQVLQLPAAVRYHCQDPQNTEPQVGPWTISLGIRFNGGIYRERPRSRKSGPVYQARQVVCGRF
jgi:hypothetical protein